MVSIEALLFLRNFTEFNFWHSANNGQHGSLQLSGDFAFLFGGFTFPQLLLFMYWEQDQFAAVFLEALNVFLLTFDGLVAATSVNNDSDGLGESSGQTGGLEIKQRNTCFKNLLKLSLRICATFSSMQPRLTTNVHL